MNTGCPQPNDKKKTFFSMGGGTRPSPELAAPSHLHEERVNSIPARGEIGMLCSGTRQGAHRQSPSHGHLQYALVSVSSTVEMGCRERRYSAVHPFSPWCTVLWPSNTAARSPSINTKTKQNTCRFATLSQNWVWA